MDEDNKKPEAAKALADEKRVKVLSPGMMVYKRFIRNKLAIAGMIILVSMFLFSFLGAFLYPYDQAQVFKHIGYVPLDYAVATYSSDLRFTEATGQHFSDPARAQFMLAVSRDTDSFTLDNVEYTIIKESVDYYRVGGYVPLIDADVVRGDVFFNTSDFDLTAPMEAAFKTAYDAGDASFVYGGAEYFILRTRRWCAIAEYKDFAIASRCVIDAYDASYEPVTRSFTFRLAAENAMLAGASSFEADSISYTLDMMDASNGVVYNSSGQFFAEITNIIVTPVNSNVFLSVPFKKDIRDALIHERASFDTVNASPDGQDIHYIVHRVNKVFYIKTDTATELIQIFEAPSPSHVLGTDPNGMDMMARLMYGGRISLTVGFVVVFIELIIGVVFGGISGYFSGWTDTFMMRFVDLFNSLPTWPLLLMLASILDAYRVEPMPRLYLLMVILGLMGWTGIARVVRGQILSMREQDFMVAAEASGLSVVRRTFKHLVPNVMPLLIVNATLGLGGIILTEATLSFLGLGVRYPLASWGSISNNAASVNIMTYYPWTWIPAGILIFVTVLGFNFVGDGLRDAFDPKMKR
jgi:peptide/nickel transport system permease protein